jgi:peptide chain release factor subunit 1
VSYGGENGFNQAIELSAEELRGVRFVREKKIVSSFLEEIALSTNKYSFGIDDSLKALEMGAMETCIVWENLPAERCTLKNPQTNEETIVHFLDPENKNHDLLRDATTGADLEVVDSIPLVEWLAEHYKEFGTRLEIITNKSQEGSQFCRGFGGIGGILRYQVDFLLLAEGENPKISEGDDYLYDSDDYENPF